MFTYISIEEFADGVVKKQQGRRPQGADRLTAGIPCRQEKRRKVHDLRRAHLGGRQRRHRDVPVLQARPTTARTTRSNKQYKGLLHKEKIQVQQPLYG